MINARESKVGGRNDQIKLMAASPPSKELILPAIHVYKGQDSNHISDDAKTKTEFGKQNTQEHFSLHRQILLDL